MEKRKDILFLFDVDGTLTPSRDKAPEETIHMLKELKKRVTVGFVGGSDKAKQEEQIGDNLLELFDYGFPENGTIFYENGKLISSSSLLEFLGEDKYKKLVNHLLKYLSEIECPIKRGTFIELRQSMLNLSPIGRSCSREERKEFKKFDDKEKVRSKLCEKIKELCNELGLHASIGGEISIDIFPKGWDKTYCLNHVKQKEIYFFGDMTMEGGNDYEIYKDERVKGTSVRGPSDTFLKVNERLKELNIELIK